MNKTIQLAFEGYNFNIYVECHENEAGLFIVDAIPTYITNDNVNRQSQYHMLMALKSRINNGLHSNEIKQILTRELNQQDRKDLLIENFRIKFFEVTAIIVLLVLIFIFLL